MFKAPFSFSGRITRTEFLLSLLAFFVPFFIGIAILAAEGAAAVLSVFFLIPSYWFIVAQSWKRSHDAGWHGIVSIIPYVNIVLFFVSGDKGTNQYGPNPRPAGLEPNNASVAEPMPTPPPLPDAWERARQGSLPAFRLSSFKCMACGAQNTDVEHQGTACCQFCGAPKS